MADDFSFKEVDKEGEETLQTIAQAHRFNNWMYQSIKPYCQGRILEVGSGIGNISKSFIDDGFDIVLSDIRDQYCNSLKKKFDKNDVVLLDLVDTEFDSVFEAHLEQYDTVFALNVIEHIDKHDIAIKNIKKLLKPGGTCIILVPAFSFLYNTFDEDLFHFRRYSRGALKNVLNQELDVVYSRFFNPVGIIGWYLNGNILKKRQIPSDQMKHFDRLVPIFKIIDYFTRQLFGLSVIAVANKK